jgi:hypothetical protein
MTEGFGLLSSVNGSQNTYLGFHAGVGEGRGGTCSCPGNEQAIIETVNMPWTHTRMLTDALLASSDGRDSWSPDFKLDSPEPASENCHPSDGMEKRRGGE